jgi:peptide-methionine (S)-S-oxide reductase
LSCIARVRPIRCKFTHPVPTDANEACHPVRPSKDDEGTPMKNPLSARTFPARDQDAPQPALAFLPARRGVALALGALALAIGAGFAGSAGASSEARVIAAYAGAPGSTAPRDATSEVAVFAGGCFWGVQGVFQHVKGVSNAVSGYAGGDLRSASYDAVSTGRTGHAEAVKITFDPRQITYARLLQIYFSVAKAYIAQLDQARAFPAPIVTKIEPGRAFFPAEEYHQDFLVRNPSYPYIVVNDLPKVEDLKRLFPAQYRPDPVLVLAARKAG